MVDKKKHETFSTESQQEQQEGQPEDGDKAPRSGRPQKSLMPAPVAQAVIKLYVSFLRHRAPDNWTDRQLNLELFEPKGNDSERRKDPRNALGGLLARKSIPRITNGELISQGLVNAVLRSRYEGSLQILYHPYTQLLFPRSSVREVHDAMCTCKLAQESDFFFWWRTSGRRRYRDPFTEQATLASLMREVINDEDRWRTAYFDFLAMSLGFLQEASLMQDMERFNFWQCWIDNGFVSARHWRFCAEDAQVSIDNLASELCKTMDVKAINSALASMIHITSEVVDFPSFREMEKPTPEAAGALLYCLIRDGRFPDPKRLNKVYRLAIHHLETRENLIQMIRELHELGIR